MQTHERHMLAFANLAGESRLKLQKQGELRFLLLTGTAACKGGFSNVTKHCFQRAITINPHHMIAKYESFEEALRSDDFLLLISRLDRFCTYEHAELLLENIHPNWEDEGSTEIESICLVKLNAND
ncbi:MAG: hypothetical protein P8M30_19180 [Planctomycetaceae bacterium]|nr:hypothetical protein [Planctomicrobium sp.]MDG2391434.1 hypothetical protein [Planctomycetaceae bacterium]